jgi:3,4-dihydroxy 2-butanone 4-phosphate synthase/GTP cyclohydrolase II
MTTQEVALARVLKAIDAVKAGGMVIMIDDEDRENEGDLVFAAAHVSPEKINFMTKEARGLVCLSLDHTAVERLDLPMMEDATRRMGNKSTAFTVSIEAREGVTTGISAADRAHTIRVAVDPSSGPNDIVVPGHIFPLRAKVGGVLQRAGHTEGSIDLARLAGFPPAAVICEIMNDDGTMARVPDLERFATRHNLPIVTIADLITFRLMRESLIEELHRGSISTPYGSVESRLYRSQIDGLCHLALLKGDTSKADIVDVRVHRQHLLMDVFGQPSDGGRSRVDYGLRMLAQSEAGIMLYMTQPETPEDLTYDFLRIAGEADSAKLGQSVRSKSKAEADSRTLGVGAQILRRLGVHRMRVHMATPMPLKGLLGFDLEVVDTVNISGLVPSTPEANS